MGSSKIISETPISFAEVKEKLKKIEKREKELNTRAKKTKEYLNTFATLSEKKASELKQELEKLSIPRVKDRHITKIIDMLPEDIDSVKIIFSGEETTIKPDNLKKILDTVKKFK